MMEQREREHEEAMAMPAKMAAPLPTPATENYERTGRKPGQPVPQSKLDEIHDAMCRYLSEREAGKALPQKSLTDFGREHGVSREVAKRVMDAIRRGERPQEKEHGRLTVLRAEVES